MSLTFRAEIREPQDKDKHKGYLHKAAGSPKGWQQTHLSREDRCVARRVVSSVKSNDEGRTEVGEEVRLVGGTTDVEQNQEQGREVES